MRFRERTFRTALLIAICTVLAGCGSSASTASNHLTRDEYEFVAGYGPSNGEQPVIEFAEQKLAKGCMQAQGFPYFLAQKPVSLPDLSPSETYLHGIDVSDNEALVIYRRQRDGFGIYESLTKPKPPNVANPGLRNDQYVRSLDPVRQRAYDKAFFGSSSETKTATAPGGIAYTFNTGGCLGKARTQLWGNPSDSVMYLETIDGLRGQIAQSTALDPQLVRALSAWSKCLRDATGKTFSRPKSLWENMHSIYDRVGPAGYTRARATEVKFAVADAKCVFSSKLAVTYDSAFRRNADKVTNPLRSEILHYLEVQQKAAREAEKVLNAA